MAQEREEQEDRGEGPMYSDAEAFSAQQVFTNCVAQLEQVIPTLGETCQSAERVMAQKDSSCSQSKPSWENKLRESDDRMVSAHS